MTSLYEYEFILRILVSAVLGVLIGFERQMHGKSIGEKTVALITVGSTLFVLMSPTILDGDNSRIIAQVVSGIGFLGAGIIFKDGTSVRGLTTATTAWASAAIGCLVGCGMYLTAVVGTFTIFLINMYFTHKKGDDKESEETKTDKQGSVK